MMGNAEQIILNMMDKFELVNVSGFSTRKYIVNDPDSMLKKYLFSLNTNLKFFIHEIKKPHSMSKLIRMNHLQFVIYDGSRLHELCKENNEIALVMYLNYHKDCFLTFENLSLKEPFVISTKNFSHMVGNEEDENYVTCKFVNCIFDDCDLKNGEVGMGVVLENCITRNVK